MNKCDFCDNPYKGAYGAGCSSSRCKKAAERFTKVMISRERNHRTKSVNVYKHSSSHNFKH